MMRGTEGHLDDRARRSIQVSLDFSPGVVIKYLIQRQRGRAHQVLPVFIKKVYLNKWFLATVQVIFFWFFFQLYLNRLSKKSIVSFLSFSYGDNFFFFFPSSCNLWKKENIFFSFSFGLTVYVLCTVYYFQLFYLFFQVCALIIWCYLSGYPVFVHAYLLSSIFNTIFPYISNYYSYIYQYHYVQRCICTGIILR